MKGEGREGRGEAVAGEGWWDWAVENWIGQRSGCEGWILGLAVGEGR